MHKEEVAENGGLLQGPSKLRSVDDQIGAVSAGRKDIIAPIARS